LTGLVPRQTRDKIAHFYRTTNLPRQLSNFYRQAIARQTCLPAL